MSGLSSTEQNNLSNVFSNASSLKELNLSNWKIGHVTGMGGMLSGCSSLENLDIGGWKWTDPTLKPTATNMFNN